MRIVYYAKFMLTIQYIFTYYMCLNICLYIIYVICISVWRVCVHV